jgi:hypothetical protein
MIGVEAGNMTAGTGFTEASRNLFLGSKAGVSNTTGHENVYLGHWAGRGNRLTYTSRNVMIGNISGSFNGEEGEDNVLLGNNTHLDITGLRINHSCAIGADANVHGNYSMAVGSGSNVFTDNSISMGRVESDVTLMGYNANPSTGGFRLYVNPLTGTDAAYFNGDINCNGTWYPSDSALKKNILSLNPQDANQLIDLLNPKTYKYDLLNNPSLHLPSGVQYGFLAQELEGVLPSLVKEVTAPPILDSIGQVIRH